MKARIVQNDVQCSAGIPRDTPQTSVRAASPGRRPLHYWDCGAVIEHPDAWKLVNMGVAEPADDECRAKCGMTAEQMQAAQHAARRLSAGILPQDFRKFDSGEILGYRPEDGRYIPGPNYKPGETDDSSDTLITDTDLDSELANALLRGGLVTVMQIDDVTDEDLLAIDGVDDAGVLAARRLVDDYRDEEDDE